MATPGTSLTFEPKNEHELARLKDDELIAYAVVARDAGDQTSFEDAVKRFVGMRIGIVRFWVGRKAKGHEAEEIVSEALGSIIRGAGGIKGSSPGEVVEWMRTVTQRRIADYYRTKEKSPDFSPIDDQPKDDDERSTGTGEPDSTGGVEVSLVIEQVLKERSEIQREVIRLRITGHSSKEAAEMSGDDGMTPVNVDKIFSRFRKDLAKELWDD